MVFSSNLFLFIYLPTVLLLYFSAPRRLRFVVLTLASYVFYGWADPRFIALLWWTTLFDFACGNFIGEHWRFPGRRTPHWVKRLILAISLTNSIGLLLFFKYAMFGQEMLNTLLNAFGAGSLPLLAVVLPAGISFYTFESISYVVDIYRGVASPAGMRFVQAIPPGQRTRGARLAADARSFIAFACYLAQFPHLVAGPIIRYQELEGQLLKPAMSLEAFGRGIFFLSFGLAKKVLLANTVAQAVDPVFDGVEMNALDAWWCVIAYAFQIYFDFSGYSDMAIGLALMLGFQFPRNFDAPYRATSITDFWRRWHMTLSAWLRDYLYIPLGGNRKGKARTLLNLLITMTLGGLWHGASLTFVIWGAYHGILLAIERVFRDRRGSKGLPMPASVGITFILVCLGWVFFRAERPGRALRVIGQMFDPFAATRLPAVLEDTLYEPRVVVAMVLCAACAFGGVQTWNLAKRMTLTKALAALLLFIVSVIALLVTTSNPFLYFRF